MGTAAQLIGSLSDCAELLPRVRPRRPPRPISFSDGPQQQRKSARMMHPGGAVTCLLLSLVVHLCALSCTCFDDSVQLQIRYKGIGCASISEACCLHGQVCMNWSALLGLHE